MEITYQLRNEDLLALMDEFTSQSPTARRIVRRTFALGCLSCSLVCLLIWRMTGQPAIALGVFAVGIVLVAFIPLRIKRNQRRVTAAIYREGKNRALFLPMTLTVDRGGLAWRSAAGSGNLKFEYIERVRQTATHLLIYLTVRNAYIVPRDGITSGDFDSFAWEVEKRWRSAMDSIAEPHEMHLA